MRSKQQMTRAKLARERLIHERRALKLEKKHATAAARDDAGAAQDAPAVNRTISVDGGD